MLKRRILFGVIAAIGSNNYPNNGILLETGYPNFMLLEDNTYFLLE